MWKKDKPNEMTAGEAASADADGTGGDIIAFVGKGVQFKGSIFYEGTVRIDGYVEGEIQTGGMLIVGEEAAVTAKITAGSVVSKGKITGDIAARQRVKLLAPASLQGAVLTPVFSIEEGVVFNGICEMKVAEVHELPLDRDQRQTETSSAKQASG
jgi:cytoskeletal protein CcmA (bactofilin family)